MRTRHLVLSIGLFVIAFASAANAQENKETPRPNILLAISDDQSFAHTSITGTPAVDTPAFEVVAKRGILFRQGFCLSPGCAPSRAGLLTGRYPWELREAGTHASSFPADLVVFPDLLEQAGYFVGMTGKGWGPGDFKASGRPRNPAGPGWSDKKLAEPPRGESANAYAANFQDFLDEKPEDTPFFFWFGATEPHRDYAADAHERRGVDPASVTVPPFLPDTPEVRTDIANYLAEIERFDEELGRMLDLLKARGELDRTLVIVTSDNGMPFPGAKANCFDYGFRVPLAIAYPAAAADGLTFAAFETDVPTSHLDLAPTILEAAGVAAAPSMRGKSLMALLRTGMDERDASQAFVYSSRERHSSSRYENWGYPMRAIRGERFLLVQNDHPERWPAGDPTQYASEGKLGPPHRAYTDIDDGPTKRLMVDRRKEEAMAPLFQASFAKRPMRQLFDTVEDPGCLVDLYDDPDFAEVRERLTARLELTRSTTGDPRSNVETREIFETYPRYSPIRSFPPPSASVGANAND